MRLQRIVLGTAIVLLSHVYPQAWGVRRQCQEQRLLLKEVQDLQGEVASLMDTVTSLTDLITTTLPEDCSAARSRGSWTTTAQVRPPGLRPMRVRCDQQTAGGGWTLILSRRPTYRRADFNRTWDEYKHGFGDIDGEFWIGNEVLHSLTHEVPHQLRVTLSDWKDHTAVATWDYFRVGSEAQQYRLGVDGYHTDSTAGDSLLHHNQSAFSTFDHDNDNEDHDHCAQSYGGGWWYSMCYMSHLTGTALPANHTGHHAITWRTWRKIQGLKDVTMMIRPTPKEPSCGTM